MKKTTIYFLIFVAFAITMWVLSNDEFEYPFAPTTPVAVNVDQITSGLHTAGADTILTGCGEKITWKQVKGKSCSGNTITWKKPIVTARDPHLTVISKEGPTLSSDSLLRLVDEAGGAIVPKASDTWTAWPVWGWIGNILQIILVVFIISFLIWLLGWLVQFVRDAWTNWNNQPAPVAPVAVQNQQSQSQSQPQPQPQPQSQNNYFGGLDSAINLAVQNGRSVELTLKIGGSSTNNPSPNNITPNPSNTDNSDMD